MIDDIGEVVFTLLLKKKMIKNFSWDDYSDLIKIDRPSAYKKVIEVMKGITRKELEKKTNDILLSNEKYIEIDNVKIPIPKPNLVMQEIITFLRLK